MNLKSLFECDLNSRRRGWKHVHHAFKMKRWYHSPQVTSSLPDLRMTSSSRYAISSPKVFSACHVFNYSWMASQPVRRRGIFMLQATGGVFVRQHPLIMLRPCVTHLLQQWYCRSLVRSSTYFLVAHTKYCTTNNSCGHKQHGHGLIPPCSDSIWLVGEMVHGVTSNYLWHFCFVFLITFYY